MGTRMSDEMLKELLGFDIEEKNIGEIIAGIDENEHMRVMRKFIDAETFDNDKTINGILLECIPTYDVFLSDNDVGNPFTPLTNMIGKVKRDKTGKDATCHRCNFTPSMNANINILKISKVTQTKKILWMNFKKEKILFHYCMLFIRVSKDAVSERLQKMMYDNDLESISIE